jgi:hypothetical protein
MGAEMVVSDLMKDYTTLVNDSDTMVRYQALRKISCFAKYVTGDDVLQHFIPMLHPICEGSDVEAKRRLKVLV